jgi:glutathione S-transferase
LKLFYIRGASSLAAHIVLEWTKAAYEAIRIERPIAKAAGGSRNSVAGAVPLLMHGDLLLSESVAILSYLADLHPHEKLMGDGSAVSRAEVFRWLAYLNSDVHGAFKPIFFPEHVLPGSATSELMAGLARNRIRDCLRRLDSQLQGREWLTGSRSVADAYLLVMLRWAMAARIGLKSFRNLLAFMRRLHKDPGVHSALVLEEGLDIHGTNHYSPCDAIRKLIEHLPGGGSTMLSAEVVGPVEYRLGEGTAVEVRRGIVHIEVTLMDSVLSWVDENYRGEAAIPFANFSRYVADGAIRLLL